MTDQTETNLIPFPQPEETTILTHFDRAKRELELASSIDEVKQIRDQAEALRQYARQQKLSLEMQNRCAEIKIRAERRARAREEYVRIKKISPAEQKRGVWRNDEMIFIEQELEEECAGLCSEWADQIEETLTDLIREHLEEDEG